MYNGPFFSRTGSLSLPGILTGFLGALYGVEFGIYTDPASPKRLTGRMAAWDDRFTPEQLHIIQLMQVAEKQLEGGHVQALKKTCYQLASTIKNLYRQASTSAQRYDLLPLILYRLFMNSGDFFYSKGLSREALGFYSELLKYFPKGDALLLKKAARVYYTMGLNYLPEAERLYRQALKLNPGDLDVYENLGRILENIPERRKDALLLYREALGFCRSDLDRIRFYTRLKEFNPLERENYLRLGRLYLRLGMFIEARRCLEEALEVNRDTWAALELADIYCSLNEVNRAKELLATLNYKEEDALHQSYLVQGRLRETEESREKVRECYEMIPPHSSLFWKSRLKLAQLALQSGGTEEAVQLAGQIPKNYRKGLQAEYLELLAELAKALHKSNPPAAEHWGKRILELDPHYHLRQDICRRSMGPGFWRKYEAMEVIGNGAAGQVWLGRDRHTGHKVAIKEFNGVFLTNPTALRRIQGQLKNWREMKSPLLLNVYEDCYYQDSFFYAMDYIEGDSLAHLIREEAPLPLTRAAAIVLQLCAALHYLHEKKIFMVFGALHPNNILLSRNNRIIIAGFDFLWALEGKLVFSSKTLKERSAFLHPSLYFAPEKFSNKGTLHSVLNRFNQGGGGTLEEALHGVDHRADLYSLGVIFYQLVTGFLPFKEPSFQALISFHSSRSLPSPRLLHPALPHDLEDIILRLMAKNPQHRFSAPAEVSRAINKARIT